MDSCTQDCRNKIYNKFLLGFRQIKGSAMAQSVRTVGYELDGRGKRFFSASKRPASYTMGTGSYFPRGEVAGA
jgi:hypothetical protein